MLRLVLYPLSIGPMVLRPCLELWGGYVGFGS
jgi:hypothetical protein